MDADPPADLDLDAYFARIGYRGGREPTLATLRDLHVAHLGRIPFENVDVRLGRPIRLDLGSLQDKLVARRRGGYCFEQNTLFAAVLRALGFEVETLEARVRPPGARSVLPRTHMLLRVTVDGRAWLADVGFGGDGPLDPVPLDGAVSEEPIAAYRVEPEPDGVYALRRGAGSTWTDLYAFQLRPALPVDFEVANHFTSTHPESIFRRGLTVQRSRPEARHFLHARTYTLRRAGEESRRTVTAEEVLVLLAEPFGLDLTEDEALEALGPPPQPAEPAFAV